MNQGVRVEQERESDKRGSDSLGGCCFRHRQRKKLAWPADSMHEASYNRRVHVLQVLYVNERDLREKGVSGPYKVEVNAIFRAIRLKKMAARGHIKWLVDKEFVVGSQAEGYQLTQRFRTKYVDKQWEFNQAKFAKDFAKKVIPVSGESHLRRGQSTAAVENLKNQITDFIRNSCAAPGSRGGVFAREVAEALNIREPLAYNLLTTLCRAGVLISKREARDNNGYRLRAHSESPV